jgi:hypothetical protein
MLRIGLFKIVARISPGHCVDPVFEQFVYGRILPDGGEVKNQAVKSVALCQGTLRENIVIDDLGRFSIGCTLADDMLKA